MITYAQLKSIAAKNRCKVEVNPVYSKPYERMELVNGRITFKEHRDIVGYEIGVNNIYGRKGRSEWQWFWFSTFGCPDTLEDDTELFFGHRYSQLTGQYNKGVWERINVREYIINNA